jgi:hypothetical protein
MLRATVLVGLLVAPAYAGAAIYKWVDGNGTTVYSNTPPADARLAKQSKVVVPDEAPKAASEAAAREAEARRQRERELLERISRLERELAAQRAAPPPVQYVAPAMPYVPPAPEYYPPFYYPGLAYPATVVVRTPRSFRHHHLHNQSRPPVHPGFHPSRR